MKDLFKIDNGLFSALFGRKTNKGMNTPTEDTKSSSGPQTDLNAQTVKVIQLLEGGYFHPNMFKDGRLKPNPLYATSGETMFGIDRKAGGSINTTPAGKKFWGIIDGLNWANTAKWNYKPTGKVADELARLAADIIRPEVVRNFKNYLSPEAQAIVYNSPRLLFHFIYATWNGAGWFKWFASVINNAVKQGETNPDKLFTLAIRSRTELFPSWAGANGRKLITQGGKKILKAANDDLI